MKKKFTVEVSLVEVKKKFKNLDKITSEMIN